MSSVKLSKIIHYLVVALTGIVISAGGYFLRQTTKSIEALAADNSKNHGLIRAQLAKQDTVAVERFGELEDAIMLIRWVDSVKAVEWREHKLEVDEHLEGPCHEST